MAEIAEYITNYLLKKRVINENEKDIYCYGFQTGIEMIICCIAAILISLYFDSFVKLIVLISVFFPLRAYSGGLHMKHFYTCFLCSCFVITGSFILPEYTINEYFIFFEAVLLLLIHCLAFKVIECDDEERKHYSKMRIVIVGIIIVLSVLFAVLDKDGLYMVVLYTVAVTFISQVALIILKIKK